MTVRPLQPSDTPQLQAWADTSGFEYPDLSDSAIVATFVVTDDDGTPILAVPAKKLVEIFGIFNPQAGAELRTEAVRAIHGPMSEALKSLGYECVEVFIPPQLERRRLGRFLCQRFGWYRNWPSFGKRL